MLDKRLKNIKIIKIVDIIDIVNNKHVKIKVKNRGINKINLF